MVAIALCIWLLPDVCNAQQRILAKERDLFGGFVSYQGNFYSGNIFVYGGGASCGTFTGGSGWKPSFGMIGDIPLTRTLDFSPRLFWDDRSGSFLATHTDYNVAVGNSITQLDLQFELAEKLWLVSADLPLKWMPFKKNNFYFAFGPSFSYIISNHYHETESILSPSNAYFKFNGRQSQDISDGTYSSVKNFQWGLYMGLGYDFPISKHMFIAPEFSTVLGFTDVLSDFPWGITTMRFSAALKFDVSSWFHDEQEVGAIEDEAVRQAQLDRVNQNLSLPTASASVAVMGIMPDGDQTPHPQLKVEEFISTDLQPVLNYVFFDDNSAVIPSRYVRYSSTQADAFSDTAFLGAGTMELYYNTLNIIGRRMRDHENAKLRIVGCNSNTGTEQGNIDLSTRRAKIVQQYFAEAWKIDPSRLQITAQNLPHDPSSPGTDFGNAENRRVEVWSDDPGVLSPITLSGMERTATPPRIRMFMNSEHPELITSWHADAIERGVAIAHIDGNGSIPKTFDWILSKLADTLIHGEEPVHFKLTVVDSAGNEATTEAVIQLQALTIRKKKELHIADKRVDKFSLFLFDFDQSTLSPRSLDIMRMVEQAVKPTSSVAVIGFCDRTGEA